MISQAELDRAAYIIAKGGIVIVPTDTIYGFSCDPDNEMTIARLNSMKGREQKPFIILDTRFERIQKYIKFNRFVDSFTDYLTENKLWPGNITIVTDKNPEIRYAFLKNHKKIAVRLTDFYVIRHITENIAGGIISTSVNTSGGEILNDAEIIKSVWGDKVDLILKGESSGNKASTIVELFPDQEAIRFLRTSDDFLTNGIKNNFREIT